MRHPFLRTLAGASAVATDPNFENVTLLLHGDGTNGGQNNTFVDGSTNNFTITRNGNTTQGTFSPYGDNWSNYFDGTGDFLSIPSNAAFAYGTSDFTVECWVYKLTSATMAVLDSNTGSPGTFGFAILSTQITGYQTWGTAFTFTHTLAINSWQHIAFIRTSGTLYLYVNGAQIGSTAASQNFVSSQPLIVGRNAGSGADQYNGYISNLRIVKGTAVYTAAFTPPTAPLTAITNTSLLTCQSNRFLDTSTNNFTITRNGDVSVQRFSPFSPTAAYAAGTIGGSGYFDGTGDNLSISSATGLCDFAAGQAFTFQVWLYRLGTGSMIFIQGGANTFQVTILSSGGGWTYGKSGVSDLFYGVGAAPVGAWTHCTLCRDTSNRTRMWINGVSVASSTSDTFAFNTVSTYIGSNNTSSSSFVQGYLSDMRILKGQALYDPTSAANIAVPTAPLTAVTNTSFLLNFTNAAILDNAMMAVPETVGNAQIDTTIKKYGTGSLEFDGTGDWLLIPRTPDLSFGTGDFTIEGWINVPSTNATYRCILSIGYPVQIYAVNGTIEAYFGDLDSAFYFVNPASGPASSITADTWAHFAVVRNGTTFTVYVNGTGGTAVTGKTQSVLFSSTRPAIGVFAPTSVLPFTGYIDDLRITKGVARYTANFTAPTAAFPDL